MLQWHKEFKWPRVLAIQKREFLGIVGIAGKDELLVQDIDFLSGLGDLCRDEANKVDLDAGVLYARRGIEGELT